MVKSAIITLTMRQKRSTPQMLLRARQLRKELTPEEQRLWLRLRGNQIRDTAFRRQHAIGPYIVDFYAPKARLVIEIDGFQHSEDGEHDAQRTVYLGEKGIRVLRFWNNDVMNKIDHVLMVIAEAIMEAEGK